MVSPTGYEPRPDVLGAAELADCLRELRVTFFLAVPPSLSAPILTSGAASATEGGWTGSGWMTGRGFGFGADDPPVHILGGISICCFN